MAHDAASPSPLAEPSHQEEPWTQVKSKNRSRRQRNRHNHDQDGALNLSKSAERREEQGQGPRHFRSVSDIAAEYRSIRAQWEDSDCCRSLRGSIAAGMAAGQGGSSNSRSRVSRGICLGIGSFDPPDGSWEAKRKTYIQLVAFLIMVEQLETQIGEKIPCIFQEPVFTANDKAFLTSLGHQVVDSPHACGSVDQNALLYGVHLYRPIYAMALKKTKPAIFIGTGWDVWDQVDMSSEPGKDLAHLQDMELEYKKFPFPQDANTTAFSSTSIYFRPRT